MARLLRNNGGVLTRSVQTEKEILAYSVLSSGYCYQISQIYEEKYIRSEYIRKILKWNYEYFKKYKKAPQETIQNIFETKKKKLKEGEEEIIDELLVNVSEEYGSQELNVEFFLDKTRDYFKERSIVIHAEEINNLIKSGMVEEAENSIINFNRVVQDTSDIFNPLDGEEIEDFFANRKDNRLFRFHGALGQVMGWFERDWLVSVTAPEKRGKSWFLDLATLQALYSNLKVLKISLEMGKYDNKKRFYKLLTGRPMQNKRTMIIPCFDCESNQDGSCDLKYKVDNKEDLLEASGDKPKFSTKLKYKPCTYCRDNGYSKNYKVETWFTLMRRLKRMNINSVRRKARILKERFGDNLKMKIFPAYSAGIKDIEKLLDILANTNFYPDVIIIDYLDILEYMIGSYSEIGGIDHLWKSFKRIAAERHCMVLSVDQAKTSVQEKISIEVNDWSDSKKKNAHVDGKFAINQTFQEKREQRMRIGSLLHRHRGFDPNIQAIVLQSLGLGQPYLDSEIVNMDDIEMAVNF
jgi:hypothetical protein